MNILFDSAQGQLASMTTEQTPPTDLDCVTELKVFQSVVKGKHELSK